MAESNIVPSLNDIGQQAYQKILFHDYALAVELLNKAIRHYPKEKELYNNRSFCYFHLKKYHLALKDSKFLMDNFPDYIKSYFRHAQNLFAIKSYKESEQLFLKVLEKDANCVEAIVYTLELRKIKLTLSKQHDFQNRVLSTNEVASLSKELQIDLYHSDDDMFKEDEVKIKEVPTSAKKQKVIHHASLLL